MTMLISNNLLHCNYIKAHKTELKFHFTSAKRIHNVENCIEAVSQRRHPSNVD